MICSRKALIRASVVGLAALSTAAPPIWAADIREVLVGHSEILRPGRAVGTIAVGNPEIADATTSAGNTILVTAKKVGTTNVIALDEGGTEIMVATLRVVPLDRRPTYTVNVVRAGSKVEYSCGPEPGCAPIKEAPRIASSYEDVTVDRNADGEMTGSRTTTGTRRAH